MRGAKTSPSDTKRAAPTVDTKEVGRPPVGNGPSSVRRNENASSLPFESALKGNVDELEKLLARDAAYWTKKLDDVVSLYEPNSL
jgi:hypothetical protein